MNKKPLKTDSPARYKKAERSQMGMQFFALDDLIPAEHQARLVWRFSESVDLSPLYSQIRAVEGAAGRDPIDPQILFSLWLYATLQGVISARRIAELCKTEFAYLWLCGGVSVNHHTLSDFRSANFELFNSILTKTVAVMHHEKFIDFKTVAQDGMRVRANAGGASFRTEKTLKQSLRKAKKYVEFLEKEESSSADKRAQAAKERAAREYEERVEKALKTVDRISEKREKAKKGSGEKARASTTDPESRKMKMADGGFRPAFNIQLATEAKSRMIVSLDVSNNGSDGGQMLPMHKQLCETYDVTPEQYLVDGGFTNNRDITALESKGTKVFGVIPSAKKMLETGSDPYARKKLDTDEMYTFRQRMKTNLAQKIYKARPSIAEFPNAVFRNMGMRLLPVRGIQKVKALTALYAISYNLRRMISLGIV